MQNIRMLLIVLIVLIATVVAVLIFESHPSILTAPISENAEFKMYLVLFAVGIPAMIMIEVVNRYVRHSKKKGEEPIQ